MKIERNKVPEGKEEDKSGEVYFYSKNNSINKQHKMKIKYRKGIKMTTTGLEGKVVHNEHLKFSQVGVSESRK